MFYILAVHTHFRLDDEAATVKVLVTNHFSSAVQRVLDMSVRYDWLMLYKKTRLHSLSLNRFQNSKTANIRQESY